MSTMNCRDNHRRFAKLLIGASMLMTMSAWAYSQTMTERSDLAAELNTALTNFHSYLSTYINSNPPSPVTHPYTLTNALPVKGYNGTCTTPDEFRFVWLPHIIPNDPTSSEGLQLEVVLRDEGGEMDIPELSHDLVCQMNTWLWHAVNGNTRVNWSYDEEGNIVVDENNDVVIADWSHFDVNCTTSTSQKFWMVWGDVGYGPNSIKIDDRTGNEAALNIIDDMWKPYQEKQGRIIDKTANPEQEIAGPIQSNDLLLAGNANYNVWIARRHNDNDGKIEIKRAWSKLVFDYDYRDENGQPSSDYDYIGPFYDAQYFPYSTYTKRLTSIELKARIQGYSPDDCPQSSLYIQPNPSQAELEMTINYVDASNVSGSETCSISWDDIAGPDENNQSLWDRLHGNNSHLWGEFGIDENGMLYFVSDGSCSGSSETYGIVKLRSRELPADECRMVLGDDGAFNIDPMTGNLTYTYEYGGQTVTESILCFDFCETLSGTLAFDNVLAATAHTLANEWSYDPNAHGAWSDGNTGAARLTTTGDAFDPYIGVPDNSFQRASRGRWRPDNAYVYRTAVKTAVGGEKIYDNAGLFVDEFGNTEAAFDLFTWRDPASAVDKWLNPSTITRYAPSGESIEEHNIMELYATAHLAHEETVPNLVAINASYEAVDFESFEEQFGSDIVETYAHSGKRSLLLSLDGTPVDDVVSVELTDQIVEHGLLLKFWLKRNYNAESANPPFTGPPVFIKMAGQTFTTLAPENYNTLDPDLIHNVAQTGAWTLYQLLIDDFGSVQVGEEMPVQFTSAVSTAYSDSVWIDDVRMQPLDASMTCFVYDRHTLRPVAQFDDQHFGIYSRYNGEGAVVSVLRETERGLATLSETQSWVKTEPRHVGAGPPSSIQSSRGFTASSHGLHVGPIGLRNDYDDNFSIINLQIGPQGPTAQLFDGETLPLDNLGELLDFRKDFPNLDMKELAQLSPDLSEVKRLQLLKELIELDEERRDLTAKLSEGGHTEERLAEQLDHVESRRNEILYRELGLTEEEAEELYNKLGKGMKEYEGEYDRDQDGAARNVDQPSGIIEINKNEQE